MHVLWPLPHAPRALLAIGILTFLSVTFQLVAFWGHREGLLLQSRIHNDVLLQPAAQNGSLLQPAQNNTLLQPAQDDKPQPTIGRVYMHYGHGAQEKGVPLDAFYNESMRLHLTYDTTHGYPSYVLKSDMYEGVWNKIVYLSTIIAEQLQKPEAERLQWLCWTDRDIVLMNPLLPLSIFIPPRDMHTTHLLITQDFQALNAGIFFLRVSKWSYTFLAQITAFRAFKPGFYLNWLEQSAIIALIEQHPDYIDSGLIRYVPQNWFNAYHGPRNNVTGEVEFSLEEEYNTTRHGGKGVMMFHFAGPDKANMRLYLEIAKSHDEAWEVPLEETTYPQEIEEFWEEARKKLRGGLV